MDHLLKNAINNLEVLAREKGPLLPDRGRLIHSFLDCRLASAFAHPGDGFNTNVHTRKRNEFRKRRSTECPQVIALRGDARPNGPSADASYISERGGIRGLSPITHFGEGKARLDLPRRTHPELVCCGVFKDIAGWSPHPNPEGDYPLCSWLFRCRGRGCESRSIRSVSAFRTEESVGLGRTPQLALRTQSDVWKNPQSELSSGSRLLAVLRVARLQRKVREASWILASKEGSMARRSVQPCP